MKVRAGRPFHQLANRIRTAIGWPRVVFPEPTQDFSITVDLTAEMVVINPFDFFIEPYAETLPFAYPDDLAQDLAPYLAPDEGGPRLDASVAALRPAGERNRRLHRRASTRPGPAAGELCRAHGAGRAESRRHAVAGLRLLP